jgi:aspartyl protease family protein
MSWLATAAMLFAIAYNLPAIRRAISQTVTANAPAAKVTASQPVSGLAKSGQGVELHADRSGHFAATVEINGRPFEALVDTGATIVMLTYEDAQRAGFFLSAHDFTMQMQTANGVAKAAPVTIERISIGNITVRNVQAGVGEPGLLRTNLLGMSFLKRLDKFEIRSGTLVLQD